MKRLAWSIVGASVPIVLLGWFVGGASWKRWLAICAAVAFANLCGYVEGIYRDAGNR